MSTESHLKSFRRLLQDGEEVLYSMHATLGKPSDASKDSGVLVLTDRRVAFHRVNWLFAPTTKSLDLDAMTATREDRATFMLMPMLIVEFCGPGSFTVWMNEGAMNDFIARAQQQKRARAGARQAAPTVSTLDSATLLAKLGELKAAGVITEEEFAVKKAELLAKI